MASKKSPDKDEDGCSSNSFQLSTSKDNPSGSEIADDTLRAAKSSIPTWSNLKLPIQYLIFTTLQTQREGDQDVARQLNLTAAELSAMQEKINLRKIYPVASDHIRQYCQAAGWGASYPDSVALFDAYADYLEFATAYELADADDVEQGRMFLRQHDIDERVLDAFQDDNGYRSDSVHSCPAVYRVGEPNTISRPPATKSALPTHKTPKSGKASRSNWSPISNHDGTQEINDAEKEEPHESEKTAQPNSSNAAAPEIQPIASSKLLSSRPSESCPGETSKIDRKHLASIAEAVLPVSATDPITPRKHAAAELMLTPKEKKPRGKRGPYKKTRERMAKLEAEQLEKEAETKTEMGFKISDSVTTPAAATAN